MKDDSTSNINDRPTPETDGAVIRIGGRYVDKNGRLLDPVRYYVDADFARRLERDRDEARETLRKKET